MIEYSPLWQTVVLPFHLADAPLAENECKSEYDLCIHVDWSDRSSDDAGPWIEDRTYSFRVSRGCTAKIVHEFHMSYIKDYDLNFSNTIFSVVPIVEIEKLGIEGSLQLVGWPWNPRKLTLKGEISVRSLTEMKTFKTSFRVGMAVRLDLPKTTSGTWAGSISMSMPKDAATSGVKQLLQLEDGTTVNVELIPVR